MATVQATPRQANSQALARMWGSLERRWIWIVGYAILSTDDEFELLCLNGVRPGIGRHLRHISVQHSPLLQLATKTVEDCRKHSYYDALFYT